MILIVDVSDFCPFLILLQLHVPFYLIPLFCPFQILFKISDVVKSLCKPCQVTGQASSTSTLKSNNLMEKTFAWLGDFPKLLKSVLGSF